MKKDILNESLRKSLDLALRENNSMEILQVFVDFGEAKNGVKELIRSHVRKINFFSTILRPSDVQAIASVMMQCEHLDEVNLNMCQISDRTIDILTRTVIKSQLKINHINVGGNNLGVKGTSSLAKLTSHCGVQSLDISYCQLRSEHWHAFHEDAGYVKFSSLDLRYNKDIGADGWRIIGGRMKERSEKLDARFCNLNDEKVKNLADGMGKSKVSSLNLRSNEDIGPKGWRTIGGLLEEHSKNFVVDLCNLDDNKVKNLGVGMRKSKFSSLSLRYNKNIGPEGWRIIGSLMEDRSQKLDAKKCDLNDEKVKSLSEAMVQAKFSSLNFRSNKDIGPKGWRIVGGLMEEHSQKLHARDCNLDNEKVTGLNEGMVKSKFTALNLFGNKDIGPEGWRTIGALMDDHSRKLVAAKCNFNERKVMKLGEGLGESKISILDLDDYGYRPVFTPKLLNLLPQVQERLCLEGWKITEDEVKKIQDELNKVCSPTLVTEIAWGGTSRRQLRACLVDPAAGGTLTRDQATSTEDLWARSSCVDEGIETAAVDDNGVVTKFGNLSNGIAISKSIRKVIPLEGDHVDIGGFLITFPPNSFDDVTPVAVRAEIDTSKWPKDFRPIAPSLDVDAPGLQKRVRVKLPIWRLNQPGKVDEASILHIRKESSKWEDTKSTVPITSDPYIEFEWKDFSPILLGFFSSSSPQLEFCVTGGVYASNANEVSIAYHIADKGQLASQAVDHIMASTTPPKRQKFPLNEFRAKEGEVIRTTIKCVDPKELKFQPTEPFSVTIGKEFSRHLHQGVVLGSLDEALLIYMQCEIKRKMLTDEENVDSPAFFTCDWTPRKRKASTREEFHDSSYKGDVTVNVHSQNTETSSHTVTAGNYASPGSRLSSSATDCLSVVSSHQSSATKD